MKTNNLQSHKPCIFILLLAFLAAFPFAAKAQVVVTHSTTPTASGVGEHTTLDAALKACNLLSGTYTITLTADCNIIDSVVIIPGMTFVINGYGRTVSRTSEKGGIINKGSTITINDLIFDGHEYILSSYSSFNKGFLHNDKGTVTLSNCTIQNVRFVGVNSAAVYNADELEMTNCTITNCGDNAVSYSQAIAGGVCNDHTTTDSAPYTATKARMTMTNCTISNCRCKFGGGGTADGVSNLGDMTMEGCRITACANGTGIACKNFQTGITFPDNTTKCLLYPFLTFRETNRIEDNSACGLANQGEIIFEDGSATYIQNNNSSLSTGGGGISNSCQDFVGYDQNHEVEHYEARLMATGSAQLIITGNSAIVEGGGIWSNGIIDFSGTGTKTITGNSASRQGGGIYFNTWSIPAYGITSGTATLNNCTVGTADNGNSANLDGGGMYLNGGTLTVTGGNCSYNEAGAGFSGGGIYVRNGTFSCTSTTFTNNSAGSYGGAIYTNNGGTLTNCTIGTADNGNSASSGGGGMYLNGGTLTVTGGTCSYNETSTTGYGGGIYVSSSSGTCSCTGTTITNNTAKFGGGINNIGTTTLTNCTIGGSTENKNTARGADSYDYGQGGGIYQGGTSSSLTLENTDISYNESVGNGGGIHIIGGTLSFTGTILPIHHNQATREGGGMYISFSSGSFSLNAALTVRNNTANDGGGIYTNGDITLQGLTIGGSAADYNQANNNGGGIYSTGATGNKSMTLNNVNCSYNKASNLGGGICNYNGSNLNMNSVSLNYNEANNRGGGLHQSGESTIAMTNTTINYNKSSTSGGGIYHSGDATYTLDNNSTVSYNSSGINSGYGGGVYVNGGSPTFTGGSITHNYNMHSTPYSRLGGGVYVNGGSPTFNNVQITDNGNETVSGTTYTTYTGGGVYINTTGSYLSSFSGCTIQNNTASSQGGGVYIRTNGTSNFYSCTIQNNTTGGFGGGVFIGQDAIMGVSGAMIVKNNKSTRTTNIQYSNTTTGGYQDDVCLRNLDYNSNNYCKIKILGDITSNLNSIGITEEQVASGYFRTLDDFGHKSRQFTIDYGDYYSSKVFNKDVFFSNDNVLHVRLLHHPSPGTTTGKIELTLGEPPARAWYVAGIVDDGDLTWGNDANSGLAPDVPKRTLTGPNGVFASGYNPNRDHIFVIRAISATQEAAVRLTDNKAIIRYPEGSTYNADWFSTGANTIPDAAGSVLIILHRYPGGHRLVNGLPDNGGAIVAGQVPAGNNTGPGANIGPVFAMDDTTHQTKLYNVHMDGMSDYSGLTDHEVDPDLEGEATHNPQGLVISPNSALLSVESGTAAITLNEHCELQENENPSTAANSGRERRIGGGVYCQGTLVCNDATIKMNQGNQGGGIYIDNTGEVTLNSSTVGGSAADKNTATVAGGGVYKKGNLKVGGKVVITDNTSGTP
ncbi:MAG: hypothetical protein IKZ55_00080 [Bacteroidales bacterium]|nr:hypothetical protein [Bacteroidales bacterium]